MRILNALKKFRFLPLLLAAFLAIDLAASALLGPYLVSSGRFILNDYEIVRRAHPEKVWDKVFFGNSIVISAYLEDESGSGYVNLGVDYGVVTDLWDMVRKGTIEVGSELVVAINDLTLYDDFDTNPGYPWHRKTLEPFLYFQRDRLKLLFTETVSQVLTGYAPPYGKFDAQERAYYYGSLSQAQLGEKAASWPYGELPLKDFQKNLRALEKLSRWCRKNGVRMRVLWMPYNPDVAVSPSMRRVKEAARTLCEELDVGWHDMGGALDRACFYDFGHLNHEYGAHVFTKEVDPWLLS